VSAKLITPYESFEKPKPILQACEEFFIHGIKYVFPGKLGALTRGVPTSYSSPSFRKKMSLGSDPIPVWPHEKGEEKGLTLEPLYHSVPKSIMEHPDDLFYEILTLLDAIRSGRAREKKIAANQLTELLKH